MAVSLKQIQGIWLAALIFEIFCIIFGKSHHQGYGASLDWRHWTVVFLTLWMVVSGFSFRRVLLQRSSAAFKRDDLIDANKKWTVAQLSSIASSVGVILWGLVARIAFSAPRWFPYFFYFVGILLLFVYRPRQQASERSVLK
jgi:hypothetical protein